MKPFKFQISIFLLLAIEGCPPGGDWRRERYLYHQTNSSMRPSNMNPFNFQISIFISILVMASSCTTSEKKSLSETVDQYTCPMHPTIVQGKPGTCPICAMDLVRKGRPGEEVKITAELNYLLKPTNAVITSSIRTIMPEEKTLSADVTAHGMITYDTRRFTAVPIRFGGRLEKVLIKYNFQPIRKGQKVLEIYSPELLTAQRDLLFLLRTDSGNDALIAGAKEKLRLLGLTDVQVNELVTKKEESYSFAVYSPVDGYIVESVGNSVSPSSTTQPSSGSSSMSGGIGGDTQSAASTSQVPAANTELAIREGMYVGAGQGIFNVVNTEMVWAEFDVYQNDGKLIKVNDAIRITVDNSSKTLEAKVNFVQPFFKGGENFTKVRVYLRNDSHSLRIGQLATASFSAPSIQSIWIPVSATLDLGTSQIVFTKRRGVFRPKVIVTGNRAGEWIQVRSGLELKDSVAYNAQFLVDSEGFIKVKN